MDCLADTVMIIRHFSEAGKIGRKAYELISGVERGQHHCYVSTISLVEILYLSEKNRIPIFGKPILMDLTGLGIRSIEYSPFHKTFFIIAGAFNDNPKFALYRWSGKRVGPYRKRDTYPRP